ncbi:selenide, water dikinase [Bryobacterales bacterium F-183]|nr:selenide, water dikinase [Bryobacterales bacterium F-183]
MATAPTTRLTAHVKAGGCAAKLSPSILDRVLGQIPRFEDPNVIVGFDTSDDAAVYRISDDLALVQTVDFFTPVVDDPFTFGAIAAANALSDVYAMGGRPISALSVLCYPGGGDLDVLAEILKGGAEKMREAGCPVVGGHSVNDPEIKFGYAVTGLIHPDRVKANTGAQVGDAVLLTKRIGTGVIGTALKREIAKAEHVAEATASMLKLNRAACEAMLQFEVHGCTDVTGFGLMGHVRELARGSGVTIAVERDRVRLLPGASEYVEAGAIPGGLNNNREFASGCVAGDAPAIFYDPQTSGGLCITMPERDAESFIGAFPDAYRIGSVLARGERPIQIV